MTIDFTQSSFKPDNAAYINAAYANHVTEEPEFRLDDNPDKKDKSFDVWTDFALDEASTATALSVTDSQCKSEIPSSGATVILSTRSSSLSNVGEEKKSGPYCRPRWASVKTFCVLICILQAVNGLLVSGYELSVLTTIENRFGLSSTKSGFVISSYEIGSLLSVVFVSYFGTHGHVPRWIGVGGIVCAVGSFTFTLSQFVAAAYQPTYRNVSADPPLCGDTGPTDDTGSNGTSTLGSYLLLVGGQILLGAGGSPMLTLGTTYLDNNAEKPAAALYIAFMYVMMVIGPVCGFLLGSALLQVYVYPFSKPPWLAPSDRMFVGLWWGGSALCGVLYILSALPFMCFPRRVSEAKEILTETAAKYGRSWKKIPISIYRLATNSVYIVATLNACLVMTIVNGMTTFLPKYIETQFDESPSVASALTGVVAVPGLCFGIYFGGWVIKRLKLEMKGVSVLVMIVNVISSVLLVLFFVFGCQNLPIAGLTAPYNSSSNTGQIWKNDSCNAMCNGCTNDYYPICGVSDDSTVQSLTYISPCHAGCTYKEGSSLPSQFYKSVALESSPASSSDTKFTFYNCSCIPDTMQALSGKCNSNCVMIYPFLALLLIVCMAASNNQMPLVLITLRSVAEEEKAFALGVQVVLLRLLCYLPAPIEYGDVIDTACITWNMNGNSTTSCALYDIEKFRIRFVGLSTIYMAAGLLCTIFLFWCIRRRVSFSDPVTMAEIAHRVADNKNLHIVSGAIDKSARRWTSDKDLYNNNNPETILAKRHHKTRSC